MSSFRSRSAVQSSSRRGLRVGVLLGGQLVEERIFAGDMPVKIGQSLRCDLSIPVDGMPYEHAMFVSDQGQRLLRLTAAMDGRIASGSTIRTQLRDGAGDAGIWTVPLEKGVRGRIQIGDATVLFQEVAMPAITPRPQLPASIRGNLLDRVDRRLAVVVGLSLMAHVAIGTWASLVDRELGELAADAPNQTYQQTTIIENPIFPDIVPPTPADPTNATTPSTNSTAAIAPVKPAPSTQIGQRPSKNPSAPTSMSEDEIKKLAGMMTAEGPDGTTTGGMGPKKPLTDLEKELAEVKNGTVDIGDREGGFREDRTNIASRPGTIANGPDGLQQTPDKQEKPPIIVPRPGPNPGPGPSIDPILAKIKNHYMGGLQRCYRKGLSVDATLAGTLKLSFTVDASGRVSDAEAVGLTSEVSSCVEQQMSTWRFAAPRDSDNEPTDGDFHLSLAMQPS